MIQELRPCTPSAGGPGSIPGQGTRSHMLQLRVHMLQLKILHVATNSRCSQINKCTKKKKKKVKGPILFLTRESTKKKESHSMLLIRNTYLCLLIR